MLCTDDQALLSVAKSILADAGIRSLAKGEGLQDLLGLGRVGTGYNVLAGPVELQVMLEDQEGTLALLEAVSEEEQTKEAFTYEGDCPHELPSNLLSTVRSAWWRRLIWIAPSALFLIWVLVIALSSGEPEPAVRTVPDLPATAFDQQVRVALYGRIWIAEGGPGRISRLYNPHALSSLAIRF